MTSFSRVLQHDQPTRLKGDPGEPGLHTLGILLARPPGNPHNRLITKTLQKGKLFVFPKGLIQFQQNVGYKNAVAIGALSNQNPEVITIANAVFGLNLVISNVLAKAFQVDRKVVNQLQSQFWMDNN
ncbi:hypothetical protein AMTR_s00033p00218030 [Amborella trichopoda]|uniref:Germin-like protein n=1 Tax=Amborella trichopoda TaxID=13333 RepID=U5CYY1_AMBTC|nr:hypothetical protein AMTR_s00033p00218030 [Amborella trichopoda]